MTGLPLIFVFVLAIVLMIFMISKWKIHPFISIMLISVALGLIGGIPLVNQTAADGTVTKGLATVIGEGFSSTFTSIGIVIILGALIGSILEQTGAALKLADMVIHLVGKNHPVLAMELMGWVVSIPVFCDSGFVILNPIRKALVQRTGASSVSMSIGLASGLYIAHVFIPPTPGPIAAASTLGVGDNLLLVMGMGALCSVFPLIAGYLYANYIGKKVKADDEADRAEVSKSYEELVAEYGKLPSAWDSLSPIIMPIIHMAAASVINAAGITGPAAEILNFLGTPIIALAVGTAFAIPQLATAGKLDQFYKITDETLKTVGPILFVTAAGGVLGRVISNTDMIPYISSHAELLEALGIFFPFLLSAILKTAQGSSTVALTTTAGIVAPLLSTLGLGTPIRTVLACMAIGAGAMTVSHANDSYFWVVTNFGAMDPQRGYRTQTMNTLILGLSAMLEIFLLSLFLH